MADFGRISHSFAETVIAVPDATGRLSHSMAEVVLTVPLAEAAGRLSHSFAEVVIAVPLADTATRLTHSMAEVTTNEVGPEARVSLVVVEVFSKAPTPNRQRGLQSGVQGTNVSTFK